MINKENNSNNMNTDNKVIDWENRRYEIAKEILPTILDLQKDNVSISNLIDKYKRMQEGKEPITGEIEKEILSSARLSVAFADGLIKFLK